jgi:hypothetical protein
MYVCMFIVPVGIQEQRHFIQFKKKAQSIYFKVYRHPEMWAPAIDKLFYLCVKSKQVTQCALGRKKKLIFGAKISDN